MDWCNIVNISGGIKMSDRKLVSRRAMLATTVAMAATPALAEGCGVGPPKHHKGPLVFMDYDQLELDASYDQVYYEPLIAQVSDRLASNSESMRARIGTPLRVAYGPTEIEKLEIYRTNRANAPIFIFIHGGNWLVGSAKQYGYPAEMFVNAGAHYVALDFVSVKEVGGDLSVMAAQVRGGIAWVYKNAASFGGDASRLYIGGHSSGGHLCGVALVTDWQQDFGLPPDFIKGGLCMSGMYDLKPVRLSRRSEYIKFNDEMEQTMSSQRHIDGLRFALIVTYGTNDTPELQRQARDFAAAVKASGKSVELIQAANF